MNEVKLNKNALIDLGDTISEKLIKYNIKKDCHLIINVDDFSFKKIDEDLFYKSDEKDNVFIPSENTINLKFNNLFVEIKKNN